MIPYTEIKSDYKFLKSLDRNNNHNLLSAIALFDGSVKGKVIFNELVDCLQINVDLKNVPDGLHGFHVHEYGDLSNGCESAGSHFDISNHTHGGLDDVSHSGDLGNLNAVNNMINCTITTDKISLHGNNSILGRSIVLHADPDDLGKGIDRMESLKTGNSGMRIGCAVIGLKKRD